MTVRRTIPSLNIQYLDQVKSGVHTVLPMDTIPFPSLNKSQVYKSAHTSHWQKASLYHCDTSFKHGPSWLVPLVGIILDNARLCHETRLPFLAFSGTRVCVPEPWFPLDATLKGKARTMAGPLCTFTITTTPPRLRHLYLRYSYSRWIG